MLTDILESGMLVAFGLAWPANIMNSLRVKSSRTRSVRFLIIIMIGYVFGLSAKILGHKLNYVAIFYLINLLMISFDTFLYYHYRRLDRIKDQIKEKTTGGQV